MEGAEQGEFVSCEIYPSPPFGIVPGVTPHVTWPPELLVWWRERSTEAKAQVPLDPDAAVPEPVLAEVTRSGAALPATCWTSVQAGPDGFQLPRAHRVMIRDLKLVRAYVLAEQALAAAEKADPTAAADRQLRSMRNQAKAALDEHRLDQSSAD